MANFLAATLVCAVLLGSSCSEAMGSYQQYGSTRRSIGRDYGDRGSYQQPTSYQRASGRDTEDRGSNQQHGSSRRNAGRDTEDTSLRDMVNMLKKDVHELKKHADCPVVTFTAIFVPETGVVSAGETIVFPRVPNVQTTYDTTTGIFTAPVDGIYIVGLGIRPFDIDPTSDFASVQLIRRRSVDGALSLIGFLTSSNDGLDFDVSSLITIPYLAAGDEVFVKNDVNASFGTGTIFSAVLIKQVTVEDLIRLVPLN